MPRAGTSCRCPETKGRTSTSSLSTSRSALRARYVSRAVCCSEGKWRRQRGSHASSLVPSGPTRASRVRDVRGLMSLAILDPWRWLAVSPLMLVFFSHMPLLSFLSVYPHNIIGMLQFLTALLLCCSLALFFISAIRSCCTGSRAPGLAPKSLPVRFQHPTGVVLGARRGTERRIKRPSTDMSHRRDSRRWYRRNLRRISAGRSRREWPAVIDSTTRLDLVC